MSINLDITEIAQSASLDVLMENEFEYVEGKGLVMRDREIFNSKVIPIKVKDEEYFAKISAELEAIGL